MVTEMIRPNGRLEREPRVAENLFDIRPFCLENQPNHPKAIT